MTLPRIAFLATIAPTLAFAQAPVGVFDGHSDVGTSLHPGSAAFDAGNGVYTLTGSGENMWATADAFHFAWKRVSGDVTLTADIAIVPSKGDAHRKAVLMVRQTLDADSAYADVAIHGDGLTSIQSRDERGAATHEVQANTRSPKRVRLQKIGSYFYLFFANDNGDFDLPGGSMRVALNEPFYVGIGVCAHNKDNVETATFSNVTLVNRVPRLVSTLETVTVSSTDRRVVAVFPSRIEAPNWTPDGKHLIYNGDGKLHRIPVDGGPSETIPTGFANRINNDHGISPDGKTLVISDGSQDQRRSIVYTLPIEGGTPKRITVSPNASYWHGWSPDGETLAFVGDRGGNFDIYSIPAAGGEELRLTTADGLDDGPEYSPDGKYIYFNSERSGLMQIWRMNADGSGQEQITSDDANNWFPHIAPDGKKMVFITFDKSVKGHPQNKDVALHIMDLESGRVTVLAKLFGGQGTLNVPSWSPDSRRLAFVSYQLIP